MRDKLGNKLTRKEYAERFKEGVKSITPLQQSKISLMGSVMVIVGVIIGLITTFTLKVWWLFIILCGSMFLTSISFLSLIQKFWAFKRINNMIKGGKE